MDHIHFSWERRGSELEKSEASVEASKASDPGNTLHAVFPLDILVIGISRTPTT